MNALPSVRTIPAPVDADSADRLGRLRRTAAAGLALWPLLGILTSFWIYVALSNVLYAHSMQVSFASVSREHLFAAWDARVLQHVFLYPALLGCVWTSLRIGWQPAWRRLPLQLLLGLAFSALAAPALVVGEILRGEHEWKVQSVPHGFSAFFGGVEPSLWLASATSFLLTYGFGLALITGFAVYQRFRDSQLRFAALERALNAAHLAALRMQLSPHTLFNLLHTIRGQIGWDPAAAQAMVVQLGDLLRRLLSAGERDFSQLTDELEFVRLYLELQQQRFADRLRVRMAGLELLPPVWVPSLILQPLVENAVVHGLDGHAGAVEIRVEAGTCDDGLWLRVINTIASDALVGHEGIGLRNVRERLAVQFGARAALAAGAAVEGTADVGIWVAEIRMPLLRDGPEPRRDVR